MDLAPLLPKEGWQPLRLKGWFSPPTFLNRRTPLQSKIQKMPPSAGVVILLADLQSLASGFERGGYLASSRSTNL